MRATTIRWALAGGALALFVAMAAVSELDSPPAQSPSSTETTRTTAPRPVVRRRTVAMPIAGGGLRLEGQVTDGDDHPIAGAMVTVNFARTTTSEADGTFAFERLAEGSYVVTAEKGEAYGEVTDARLDDTSEPVIVATRSGPTLTVRVIDGKGAPIAHAKVEARNRASTTGDDGVVQLRAVDGDGEAVTVTADHYAPVKRHIDTDDPSNAIELTIVLQPGAPVAGIVVGPDGNPVARAWVQIDTGGGNWFDMVRSDDNGAWSFDSIGPGKHALHGSADDLVEMPDIIFEHDGLHPTSGLVVHLDAGGQITGLVVDPGGNPVAGAKVSAGTSSAESDARGRFVAKGLPAGEHEVSASTETSVSRVTKLTLPRGGRGDVRLVLVGATIAGMVVDTRGEPVGEAIVGATAKDETGTTRYIRTDERGHFDFGGMLPGSYDVAAQRQVEASRDLPAPIVVAAGDHRVRLVLADPGTITGRVVADGKPVPYFGLIVSSTPELGFGSPSPIRAADGRFTQTDLSPGLWGFVIAAPGYVPRVIPPVWTGSGATIDLGDLAVERGRSLTGRVVDEQGLPIAGATVTVAERRGRRDGEVLHGLMVGTYLAHTGADGRYRIDGIDPGRTGLKIDATHPTAGAAVTHELAATATEADLVIAATGAIAGDVTNFAERVHRVVATRAGDDDTPYIAPVDASGTFRYDALPPGDYTLRLVNHDTVPRLHVHVTANARTAAVFELPREPITLVVHAAGCRMVEIATLAAEHLDSEPCTDGVAEIHELSPGSYRLCCDGDDPCAPVEVEPGATRQSFALR